jgi:flagellar hook protein FlgE
MRLSRISTILLMSCFSITGFASPSLPHSSLNYTHHHHVSKGSYSLDLNFLIKDQPQLFFVLKNPETGAISYTQDGLFFMKDNYYYHGKNRLQGYVMPTDLANNACTLTDVKLPGFGIPATATSVMMNSLNLDSNSVAPTVVPFDRANIASWNYSVAQAIYDSLGNTHTATLYFVLSSYNYWAVNVFVDENPIGSGRITFDSTGLLTSTEGLSSLMFNPGSGAAPQVISFVLDGTTQFGMSSSVWRSSQDGLSSGALMADSVDMNGYMSAEYTNGQSILFSKVAVVKN